MNLPDGLAQSHAIFIIKRMALSTDLYAPTKVSTDHYGLKILKDAV